MAIDYRDIGARIRKKREECNMSQAELASKVQLSIQHISNVENARSKIGLEKLVAVANVLDCSLDELVCGSVRNSKSIYHSEIAELLEDFSEAELRVVPEFLKNIRYVYDVMRASIEEEKKQI